ncbi:transposase, partial [Streptomyces sp. NBRC 110611]|uniref:transposase n=1 Tax=Streptomyces sp. NBRC 110611 TaxID=1621259 RepID=UPI0037D99E71
MRKGDSYATILVDLEARRPSDVLPGRDAEPLAAWLSSHPEVETICRDRAGTYAEGARTGAPQAAQIADGWHLWRSLAEAVEKTVGTHHSCIRAAFTTTPSTGPDATEEARNRSSRRTGPSTTTDAHDGWWPAPRSGTPRCRNGWPKANPWLRSAVSCGWTIPPCAGSPARPASTNSWSRP